MRSVRMLGSILILKVSCLVYLREYERRLTMDGKGKIEFLFCFVWLGERVVRLSV